MSITYNIISYIAMYIFFSGYVSYTPFGFMALKWNLHLNLNHMTSLILFHTED